MGLQVWLPLNGDLTQQGLSGVAAINSGATVDNNGKIGKCYSSSGTAYIDSGYGAGKTIDNLSICCWFKFTTIEPNKIVFGSSNGNNQRCYLGYINNLWCIAYGGTAYSTGNGSSVGATANVWQHLAVVVKDKVMTLYVNGVKTGQKITLSTAPTAASNIFAFDYGVATSYRPKGCMNDFRIYDHALSDKEVKEISKGLMLHYKLDGNGLGNPNFLQNSESPQIGGYSGTTVTRTIVSVPEWGATNAVRHAGTGGTSTIVCPYGLGKIPKDVGVINPMISAYVKNNHATNSIIFAHNGGGKSVTLKPGESKYVYSLRTNPMSGSFFQLNMCTPSAGQVFDFTIWRLKFEDSTEPTPWCPNNNDDMAKIIHPNTQGTNIIPTAVLSSWSKENSVTVDSAADVNGYYKINIAAGLSTTRWGIFYDFIVQPYTEYVVSMNGQAGTLLSLGYNNSWGNNVLTFTNTSRKTYKFNTSENTKVRFYICANHTSGTAQSIYAGDIVLIKCEEEPDCSGFRNNGLFTAVQGTNMLDNSDLASWENPSGSSTRQSNGFYEAKYTGTGWWGPRKLVSLTAGTTYTLSCSASNIKSGSTISYAINNSSSLGLIVLKDGYNVCTFTPTADLSSPLLLDDINRTWASGQENYTLSDFRIEKNVTEYDYSGFKNDGVIYGALIPDADGKVYSNSLKLSTGSDYIKSAFSATMEQISVSFWVKPSSSNGGYSILSSNFNNPSGGLWISTNCENSKVWAYIGAYITVSGSLANDIWHHCVFTFDNGTPNWYINGEKQTLSKNTYTKTTIPIGGLTIGNSYTGTSWNTKRYGNVSDYRLYATALSADDVKSLYESRMTLDNKNNIYVKELDCDIDNRIWLADKSLDEKVFENGLNKYTQSNCQVTLTNDGYRIYRPANLVHNSSTMHNMWGGFLLRDDQKSTIFRFEKNHTYILLFDIKGKSSNAPEQYWSNEAGWSGGSYGLGTSPTNVSYRNLGSNFNLTNWTLYWYKFTISDDVFKTCKTSYSSFVAGTTYNCYRDFKFGWAYSDTGSIGTDVYIKNIRLYDITNTPSFVLNQKGILNALSIEEGLNRLSFNESWNVEVENIYEY